MMLHGPSLTKSFRRTHLLLVPVFDIPPMSDFTLYDAICVLTVISGRIY